MTASELVIFSGMLFQRSTIEKVNYLYWICHDRGRTIGYTTTRSPIVSLKDSPMSDSMPTLECLTQEIQQIPSAQWNNLLELLKIFRQSVNPPQTLNPPIVNQAALDLLRSWREEGNEDEHTEPLITQGERSLGKMIANDRTK